ncbi:MAG: hypothetical protein Q8K45_16950 [Rubrivivax sp.]|nr:hypothetical protein [Rubrivivax sp.]
MTQKKTPVLLAATLICSALLASASVFAKLPAPSDEAKAKAAEAAAKAAHGGKVEGYMLCKSMDAAAAAYYANAKKAGKETKAPAATPPCVSPGPFVYVPPAPAASAATAPAVAAAPKK